MIIELYLYVENKQTFPQWVELYTGRVLLKKTYNKHSESKKKKIYYLSFKYACGKFLVTTPGEAVAQYNNSDANYAILV